jgi:NAD(P)H-dependent FMN reductase
VGRQAGRGQPGWKADLIDLAELPLAINLGASAGTAELATRISDAAAILVVTCEYNHGYPARCSSSGRPSPSASSPTGA